jgi:hypothetical protein
MLLRHTGEGRYPWMPFYNGMTVMKKNFASFALKKLRALRG